MDFWFSERHTPDVKISLKVKKQLYSKKSDYQKIDVFDTYEFGKVLALDGNIMLTKRLRKRADCIFRQMPVVWMMREYIFIMKMR